MKLSDLFGEWKNPKWMSNLKDQGKKFFSQTKKTISEFIKKEPKKIAIISIIIATLFASTMGTIKLIKFLTPQKPEIVKLRYTLSAHPVYDIKKDFLSRTVELNFSHPILSSIYSVKEEEKLLSQKISITPEIEGTWKWKDNSNYQTVVFTAKKDFDFDTDYEISVNKKICLSNQELETKSVGFKVTGLIIKNDSISFELDELYPDRKYVTYSFTTNFPILNENLKDFIEIKNSKAYEKKSEEKNYRALDFDYELSGIYHNHFFIKSEIIPMPEESYSLDVRIKQGFPTKYATLKYELVRSIKIPGANELANINEVTLTRENIGDEKNIPLLNFYANNFLRTEDLIDYLEIYQLPDDRPAEPGVKAKKDFNWTKLSEVSDTVISKSKKLSIIPVQQTEPMMKECCIKLDLDSYNPLFVKIKAGLKFHGGYKLREDLLYLINIPEIQKFISYNCDGNIVNLKGSHKIEISSIDVEKLDIKIYRMKPSEINHIASMSNGNLRNFDFNHYYFDEENISEFYNEIIPVNNFKKGRLAKTVFDFTKYLTTVENKGLKNGLFTIDVSEYRREKKDEDKDYYRYDYYSYLSEKRFFMVTDLGLILKNGNENEKDIYVQSFKNGNPVSGAKVEVIAKNGNSIKSVWTDYNGHASLGKIAKNHGTTDPVAYTISYGNDFTFMPFDSSDSYVGFSNFSIYGTNIFEVPENLNAYIFTDRGIYKPGENVNLGSIIKTVSMKNKTEDLPCILEIYSGELSSYYSNPKNCIYKKDFKIGKNGLNEFEIPTKNWSSSSYTAIIKTKEPDNTIGSCVFKVKNYSPDNLKIKTNLFNAIDIKSGWNNKTKFDVSVHLENLYGKPAVGNKVSSELIFIPGFNKQFLKKEFQDYNFGYIPSEQNISYNEIKNIDCVTDKNGNAHYKIDLSKYAKANFVMSFRATGYEKNSGKSVSEGGIQDGLEILYSPYDYLVGWKTNNDFYYLDKNSNAKIDLIAVDNHFNKIDLDEIDCTLYEEKYISVLTRQNGIYKYQSEYRPFEISSEKITISKNGNSIKLPTNVGGEFFISLKKDKNELQKIYFSVAGQENLTKNLGHGNELQLKVENKKFKPGENAKIFIKAPYKGSGYIFVERGKVFYAKHFTMDSLSKEENIFIPKELDGAEGNVYITAMISKDVNSEEVYMNPFSYGTIPIELALDKVDDKIKLEVPETIMPGKKLHINYSSNKNTKIILMAVDEGIIRFAKHKNPDPLNYFFQKRKLSTETYSNIDLLMPEYDVAKSLGAIGGGASMDKFTFNPFKKIGKKSVAFWSGILDCSTTQKTYDVDIPSEFNGSLKIMAVSVGEKSFGYSEKFVTVKSDLVINSAVVDSFNVGDEFNMAVTIANTFESDKNVNIQVDSGKLFDLKSSYVETSTLNIKSNDEKTLNLNLKSNGKTGSDKIKIVATVDDKKYYWEKEISVHLPTTFNTWNNAGVVAGKNLNKNKTSKIKVTKSLYPNFADRKITVSFMPSGLMDMLKKNLKIETFGETRKILFNAFSALIDKDSEDNKKIVEDAIDTITIRFNDDHIKNWPGICEDHDLFLDAFATLFITESYERGYEIDQKLIENLLEILKQNLTNQNMTYLSEKNAYDLALSIYVLTRNEVLTTNYIANLKKSAVFKKPCTNANALICASEKIMGFEKTSISSMNEILKSNDYNPSLLLYLMSKHFSDKIQIDDKWFDTINSYNLENFVYYCLGISEYMKIVSENTFEDFSVLQNFNEDKKINSTELSFVEKTDSFGNKIFEASFGSLVESLTIENKGSKNLFFNISVSGFEKPSMEFVHSPTEVKCEFVKDKKETKSLNLGDIVDVEITINMNEKKGFNDLIVADILPACLEITEDSLTNDDWIKIALEDDRVIMRIPQVATMFGIKKYSFKAKVVASGEFNIPPVIVETTGENPIRFMSYDEEKIIVRP